MNYIVSQYYKTFFAVIYVNVFNYVYAKIGAILCMT